jgi:hypothetical protein
MILLPLPGCAPVAPPGGWPPSVMRVQAVYIVGALEYLRQDIGPGLA